MSKNFVSVRVKNSYNKSFSTSHNLKSKHKTIETKLKRYCKDNNLVFSNLSYKDKYQIIRQGNSNNLILSSKDKENIVFRRDVNQELSLLKEWRDNIKDKNELNHINNLIQKTEQELYLYNSFYKDIHKNISDKIKEVEEDYKSNHNRKLRNDRVPNYGGIITFGNEDSNLSRNEMNELNQKQLDEQRHNTVKSILKSLDIENRDYYLVKHTDEYQIHYHFEFIGYNFKTHSLVRRLLTQKKMIEFQDIRGECFKQSSFERGKAKWEKVREYCNENNIDYKELSSKEKYEILKECKVKYETLKQYNNRLNNEVFSKEKKVKKMIEEVQTIELSLKDIYQKVIDKSITKEEISKLKEQSTNKLIKRFLDSRYRSVNLDNDIKSQEKALERTIKNYEKMENDLIEEIFTLEEVIYNQNMIKSSQIKVNVNTSKFDKTVKVNKPNLNFGKPKEVTIEERKEEVFRLNHVEDLDNFINQKRRKSLDEKREELIKKILLRKSKLETENQENIEYESGINLS